MAKTKSTPKPPERLKEKICPYCKEKFKQKREWQEFCCSAHRTAFHNARNLEILRQAREALK